MTVTKDELEWAAGAAFSTLKSAEREVAEQLAGPNAVSARALTELMRAQAAWRYYALVQAQLVLVPPLLALRIVADEAERVVRQSNTHADAVDRALHDLDHAAASAFLLAWESHR